jgi:hypothetical protein
LEALRLLATNLCKKLFAVEMRAQHLKQRKAIDKIVVGVNQKYF